jgi:hypothetical protein
MNLREFLSKKEEYPDNHEVTLADGVKVTLGDLRTYNAEEDARIQQQTQQLTQREGVLETAANEVAAMRARIEAAQQNPAATVDPELKELVDLLKGVRNGNKVDIFKEPGDYFKPLVDRLNAVDESIKAEKAAREQNRQDVERTITWHTRKQIDRDYRSYQDWPKDFDTRKAITYAQQNRLVDEMGYPDFDAVHERITAPVRQEANLKAERDKIRKEEREAAQRDAAQGARREPFVSMPNGGGSGGGPNAAPKGKKYGGIEKIDEGDILSDPDILATFQPNFQS